MTFAIAVSGPAAQVGLTGLVQHTKVRQAEAMFGKGKATPASKKISTLRSTTGSIFCRAALAFHVSFAGVAGEGNAELYSAGEGICSLYGIKGKQQEKGWFV